MQRKPVEIGLRTLLAGIALSATFLAWKASTGQRDEVAPHLAVILLAGGGVLLRWLGARALGSSLAAGGLVLLLADFVDFLVPNQDILLPCGCVALLWGTWVYFGRKEESWWTSLLSAAGLTWGFLVGASLFISIQNGRDSVNWPVMLPSLLVIPVLFFVPLWPAWVWRWGVRRKWHFRLRTLLLLPVLVAVLFGTWLTWIKPRMELERWRRESIAALTWGGGTPEQQFRRLSGIRALETASRRQLASPTLTYACLAYSTVPRRVLIVDWMSLDAGADGLSILTPRGEMASTSFEPGLVEHVVPLLFHAQVEVSEEVWTNTAGGGNWRVFLTRQGARVSNEVEVRFPGPSAKPAHGE